MESHSAFTFGYKSIEGFAGIKLIETYSIEENEIIAVTRNNEAENSRRSH